MAAAGVSVKDTVVLYPAPVMGHLVPMVELGKFFLTQSLAVAVIVTDPPHNTGDTAPFIARVSAELLSMSFHRLPPVSLPPISSRTDEAISLALLRLSARTAPNLAQPLTSISQTSNIRAIVLDMFCTDALDVVADFGFPTYFYSTSSASFLAVALHLPVLCNQITASFKDMGDTLLPFPGLPPIPASHMAHPMLDREGEGEVFNGCIYHFERLPRADGIIVNTFEALETRVLRAIADGLCVPGRRMPPIYCVGPMVREGEENEKHECLAWLDLQPRESVVFLCFGSLGLGLFSAEQITEISTGLERSGQRFLWVVRSPPIDDPAKQFLAPPEPDLDALLPEGFLDRTKNRGFVVKSWAPQVAVLRHRAVGGFVTHCGWNSVLEAVLAGVPMIAWPLYAEQRMNKVFLVEEMKLAVEMKGYDKVLVEAAEVEARVRWVIESEGGKELRERTAVAKEQAIAAVAEGGTSLAAVMSLVTAWKGGAK